MRERQIFRSLQSSLTVDKKAAVNSPTDLATETLRKGVYSPVFGNIGIIKVNI